MLFAELMKILNARPIVPGKTAECLQLWETFTAPQQQQIYDTICSKLRAGKFVHYDPVKAIRENVPKVQIISGDEYYKRYNTQAEQDGWKRVYIKEEQRTVYVQAG